MEEDLIGMSENLTLSEIGTLNKRQTFSGAGSSVV